MYIDASAPDFVTNVRREADRQRELADSLDMIAFGRAPTAEMLASAPVIADHWVGVDPTPCLFGRVEGHPYVQGPTTVTSRLIILDTRGRWARTRSRFYRLGSEHPSSRLYDAD